MNRLKKTLLVLLCTVIALSPVSVFAIYVSYGSITGAKTPRAADETQILWTQKFGTSYKNAPSTVSVVGNTVLVMSRNTLYKLNSSTGKIIAQAEMADVPSFGYTPPVYVDGVVYCPLDNATIQAFDYSTLRSLWVYKDKLGGQSLSPIGYAAGCIYTGFWNDEDEYADFVCIDVTDENKEQTHEVKNAKWTYKSMGGFYWAGCNFSGNSVIVGTDDGTVYANKASKVLSLDMNTGKLVDSVSIIGDQRSGITQYGDAYYFVTKAGYLYSVKINNGKFVADSLKRLTLGGASTSTPVIYNDRLYVGVQGKTLFEGSLKVVNPLKMSVIYTAPAAGYPQNSVTVSDAYFNDDGCVYIYSTYNAPPGGITVYTDRPGQVRAERSELFTPEGDMAQYSVSNIAVDEKGTLIFKNDSGYIFAVGRKNAGGGIFDRLLAFFRSVINFFRNLFR